MEFAHDFGQLSCFHSSQNGFPNAKKHGAEFLICDDIMLHIFTCSSDKDFVNTVAARSVIFFLEYKEHFVPVLNLCDQVEAMHV